MDANNESMDPVIVGGIVPLTTIDYPNHLAAVIFLQGCPWRCLYCHNQHLQSPAASVSLPWEEVINLLKSRKGFIEGIVFSGGEPLYQKGLIDAIKEVKAMNLKIGLHTAGALPDRFAQIISLLDWVGFDVKTLFSEYQTITQVPGSVEIARESLKILLASGVDFEIRVTLHPVISVDVVVEALKELAAMGVKQAVLQKCRDENENPIEHPIFSDKILLEEVSKYFDNFFIRG